MINELTQAVITMLAVINPVISGAILLQITGDLPRKDKLKSATWAALQILIILLIVAFAGQLILQAFKISLDTFQIVGGIIIAYIGFTMLTGKMPSGVVQDSAEYPKSSKVDLSPLVLFSASPGTIATLITISVAHGQYIIPPIPLLAVGVSIIITWGVMLSMVFLPSLKKGSGPKIVTQYMGLILIAMGLQFALQGYKAFMALA